MDWIKLLLFSAPSLTIAVASFYLVYRLMKVEVVDPKALILKKTMLFYFGIEGLLFFLTAIFGVEVIGLVTFPALAFVNIVLVYNVLINKKT